MNALGQAPCIYGTFVFRRLDTNANPITHRNPSPSLQAHLYFAGSLIKRSVGILINRYHIIYIYIYEADSRYWTRKSCKTQLQLTRRTDAAVTLLIPICIVSVSDNIILLLNSLILFVHCQV